MTSDSIRASLASLSYPKAGQSISRPRSQSSVPASPTLQLPDHQPSSRRRSQKAPSRDDQGDSTGEKAAINLIRRVLCPQTGSYGTSTPQPLEELLPPLTSSNDVDRQLYALLAVIIKEFIYSWYSKITPDQVLVNEVLQVIAHCTRALEQRLRQIDVAQLVLDELPALIEAHITSYRAARQQSNLSGLHGSPRAIYHALNPHPGLSPVPDPSDAQTIAQQSDNETSYRQLLVHGALAVLLPTEDLENVCLRTLVGDILADLILGNEVSGRTCEGWFLWDTTTRLIDVKGHRNAGENDTATAPNINKGRLETFGLLSPEEGSNDDYSPSTFQSRASVWMWSVLQNLYLTYVAVRFVVTGLFQVASAPRATVSRASGFSSISTATPISQVKEAPSSAETVMGKRPVLDYRLYGMLSHLIDVPRRMPWLGGLLALFQYLMLAGPGRLGDTDSVLDGFLHATIDSYLLTPTLLPNLLLATRTALFPANARPPSAASTSRTPASVSHESVPAPTPAAESGHTSDATGKCNVGGGTPASAPEPLPSGSQQQRPSPTEIAAIKRRCAASILSLVPRHVARKLFGVSADAIHRFSVVAQEQQKSSEQGFHVKHKQRQVQSPVDPEESLLLAAIEEDLLDLFADEYCNKHLIYSIIETVLAKLLPELSERSVGELMEDRGVAPS